MNDQQILLCAALCAAAAFVGFKLGVRQVQAAQAAASGEPSGGGAGMAWFANEWGKV